VQLVSGTGKPDVFHHFSLAFVTGPRRRIFRISSKKRGRGQSFFQNRFILLSLVRKLPAFMKEPLSDEKKLLRTICFWTVFCSMALVFWWVTAFP